MSHLRGIIDSSSCLVTSQSNLIEPQRTTEEQPIEETQVQQQQSQYNSSHLMTISRQDSNNLNNSRESQQYKNGWNDVVIPKKRMIVSAGLRPKTQFGPHQKERAKRKSMVHLRNIPIKPAAL